MPRADEKEDSKVRNKRAAAVLVPAAQSDSLSDHASRGSSLAAPAERQIQLLEAMVQQLVETDDFGLISQIRDKAEAVRQFAKIANSGLEAVNRACAVKLMAERQAGAIISKLKLRGGRRESNDQRDRLTIAELGITQNQSTRWQREAAIPDAQFEEYLQVTEKEGRELSSAGLIRFGATKSRSSNKPSTTRRKRAKTPSSATSWTYTQPVTISVEACQVIEDLYQHLSTLLGLIDQPHSSPASHTTGRPPAHCNGKPSAPHHNSDLPGKPDLLRRYARESQEWPVAYAPPLAKPRSGGLPDRSKCFRSAEHLAVDSTSIRVQCRLAELTN